MRDSALNAMKYLILFVFMIGFAPISAQVSKCNQNSATFEYSKFGKSENRIGFIIGKTFGSSHYLMQTNFFPITWTNNDPYNHRRFNLSINTIIDPLIKLPTFVSEKNELMFFLISLPNSKHNYFPLHDFCIENLALGISQPAIFFKQNTDFFVFRNNKWVNYSPGLGLSLYLGLPYFELGYNRNYKYDFQNLRRSDYVYFTIGLLSRDG